MKGKPQYELLCFKTRLVVVSPFCHGANDRPPYSATLLSLFENLRLGPEDTLLVRGASCAWGYAAIQLARALGCKIMAATHREAELPSIAEADQAILDTGNLTGILTGVTKAPELVGPKTLRDTLKAVEPGAIVCNTGVLGGVCVLDGFDPIKEIQMAYA